MGKKGIYDYPRERKAFKDGLPIWRFHPPDQPGYMFLCNWLQFHREDNWSRQCLVSFDVTKVVRHGETGAGDKVRVAPDGSMSFAELATFEGFAFWNQMPQIYCIASVRKRESIIAASKTATSSMMTA